MPGFDSSEVVRGYRVIRCDDERSKGFLGQIVAKISGDWEWSKLALIPAEQIPRRPRARIWLPKMQLEAGRLLKCLKLHNPAIPMEDWVVVKAEEPQKFSQSYLLVINEECLEPLSKVDNKLRFGIRQAKLKIFQAGSKVDEVDEASGLLEDMSIVTTAQQQPQNQDDEGTSG